MQNFKGQIVLTMPDDDKLESSGTSDATARGCNISDVSKATNKNIAHEDASFPVLQDVLTIIRKYFLSS